MIIFFSIVILLGFFIVRLSKLGLLRLRHHSDYPIKPIKNKSNCGYYQYSHVHPPLKQPCLSAGAVFRYAAGLFLIKIPAMKIRISYCSPGLLFYLDKLNEGLTNN